MADDDDQVSTLRASAHPVRLQILSLLTGAELSAAEIARELGLTHANASYHLRVLASAGIVVEAGEERIRGGVAKRYRHPWEHKPVGTKGRRADPAERELYVRAMAEELVRRSRLRRPGTSTALTDAELWVTPETWQRVYGLVEEASTLLHAEAKPPRTEGTIHVNMTAGVFQMADSQDGDER
jgi:DNA-binding transcriptional ArsR family regulator